MKIPLLTFWLTWEKINAGKQMVILHWVWRRMNPVEYLQWRSFFGKNSILDVRLCSKCNKVMVVENSSKSFLFTTYICKKYINYVTWSYRRLGQLRKHSLLITVEFNHFDSNCLLWQVYFCPSLSYDAIFNIKFKLCQLLFHK